MASSRFRTFESGPKASSLPLVALDKGPCLESDCEVLAHERRTTENLDLLLHTKVYALAEKYDIPSLKRLAREKFEVAMACSYDSPDFAHAIEHVYCSTLDTDRGLRDVVLAAFDCHPQLAAAQDVCCSIKRTPSLAFELFQRWRA